MNFFGRVNDGLDAGATGGDDVTGFGPFKNIGSNISLDEDVISGEPNEPPVMTLNISVPDGASGSPGEVQIQVIYYETSGIEYIQGGEKCYADPDSDPTDLRALAQAACTSGEIDDEASFVLHAESDEDAADDKKQLALQETGRFTGVFQGMLRLTDADGDGGDPRINWGRTKGDGVYTEKQAGEANSLVGAVLGVGNGPVEITYKDTDGQNKTYQIETDIQPPTITVDSPAHKGRSDDEKPSFIGTINDSDSGLAANSFQLDVDNTNE